MRALAFAAFAFTALVLAPAAARAQEFTLVIRNHRFEPAELKVPAGKRIVINVSNEDPTPEEFESRELKFEKIIPSKSKAVVRIGPLKPGRYPFFGEFHEKTAQGAVIAE